MEESSTVKIISAVNLHFLYDSLSKSQKRPTLTLLKATVHLMLVDPGSL